VYHFCTVVVGKRWHDDKTDQIAFSCLCKDVPVLSLAAILFQCQPRLQMPWQFLIFTSSQPPWNAPSTSTTLEAPFAASKQTCVISTCLAEEMCSWREAEACSKGVVGFHNSMLTFQLSCDCCGAVCQAGMSVLPPQQGFRDPAQRPWEDRDQPLVPALADTGHPLGTPADIPGERGAAAPVKATCISMMPNS